MNWVSSQAPHNGRRELVSKGGLPTLCAVAYTHAHIQNKEVWSKITYRQHIYICEAVHQSKMKQKTVKIDMQKAAGVGYKIDWHSTWASSSHNKTAWNIPLSQEPGRVENQNITGNFTPSLLSLLALLEPGHSWGGGTHLHFPPHLLLNELHWGGGGVRVLWSGISLWTQKVLFPNWCLIDH